jgi:predicted transcriptional regulator
MKYRSVPEIVDSILNSLGNGATRTQIMYKAYISFGAFNEYMSLMLERNLVSYEKDIRRYKRTEKGVRYMNDFDMLNNALNNNRHERLSNFVSAQIIKSKT